MHFFWPTAPFKGELPPTEYMDYPRKLIQFACDKLGFSKLDTTLALEAACNADFRQDYMLLYQCENRIGYGLVFRPGVKPLEPDDRERITRTYHMGRDHFGCYIICKVAGKLTATPMSLIELVDNAEYIADIMDLDNEEFMFAGGRKPKADFEIDLPATIKIAMTPLRNIEPDFIFDTWKRVKEGYRHVFRIRRTVFTVIIEPQPCGIFDVSVKMRDYRPHIVRRSVYDRTYTGQLGRGDTLVLSVVYDFAGGDINVIRSYPKLEG